MVGKYFEICCPQMAKTALEQHIFQGNIHIFSLKVLPPECSRWSVCVCVCAWFLPPPMIMGGPNCFERPHPWGTSKILEKMGGSTDIGGT